MCSLQKKSLAKLTVAVSPLCATAAAHTHINEIQTAPLWLCPDTVLLWHPAPFTPLTVRLKQGLCRLKAGRSHWRCSLLDLTNFPEGKRGALWAAFVFLRSAHIFHSLFFCKVSIRWSTGGMQQGSLTKNSPQWRNGSDAENTEWLKCLNRRSGGKGNGPTGAS